MEEYPILKYYDVAGQNIFPNRPYYNQKDSRQPRNSEPDLPFQFGRLSVNTNFYGLTIDKEKIFYMLPVNVEPEITDRMLEIDLIGELMKDLKKKYPHITFVSNTARIIYASMPINNASNYIFHITTKVRRQSMNFAFRLADAICIEPANILSTGDNEASLKMAYETICKNAILESYVIRGRRYISRDCIPDDYKEVYDIWKGWKERVFVSTIRHEMFLNVDVLFNAVFKREWILDIVAKTMGKTLPSPNVLMSKVSLISSWLRGIKVRLIHCNITKKIVDVVEYHSLNYYFDYKEGSDTINTNVYDYFKHKYSTKLKYPHYPLVQVNPQSKNIFVPLELLLVDKPQVILRNDKFILKNVSKYAVANAKDRKTFTDDLIDKDFIESASHILKNFGVTVNSGMIEVNAVNLNLPNIQFGGGVSQKPNFSNMSTEDDPVYSYYKPAEAIHTVRIYDFCNYENRVTEFYKALVNETSQRDLILPEKPMYEVVNLKSLNSPEQFLQIVTASKEQLLIFIVEDKFSSYHYGILKGVCDLSVGKISQVVKLKNVLEKRPAVLSNIGLKINAKFGGINQCAQIPTNVQMLGNPYCRVMIMGADVTHPRNDGSDEYGMSLASIVSSLDSNGCLYTNQVVVNEKGQDIITSMYAVVRESLKRYQESSEQSEKKPLPKVIIMFRDGLSEGQFIEAKNIELSAMQQGCLEFYNNKPPKITFICTQKRHNTRFYSKNNTSKNCQPGLAVHDTKICEADSFYLLSHKNIKGTAKAAHYKILHDDNKFNLKDLMQYSFAVSYNFARCGTPISQPCPIRYAHLCAFRSAHHKVFLDNSGTSKIAEMRKKLDDPNLGDERYQRHKNAYYREIGLALAPHKNLKKSMYFV